MVYDHTEYYCHSLDPRRNVLVLHRIRQGTEHLVEGTQNSSLSLTGVYHQDRQQTRHHEDQSHTRSNDRSLVWEVVQIRQDILLVALIDGKDPPGGGLLCYGRREVTGTVLAGVLEEEK